MMFALILLAAAAAQTASASSSAGEAVVRQPFNPAAGEPFERDPELKGWALRLHDRNGDGWLTLFEAQDALRSLKELADADRDGRVTVREFQAAKSFIRARWTPALQNAGRIEASGTR